MIKILFVGESWLGSCARSLKEALLRHSQIELDEVSEDLFFPKHRAKWLRGVHRVLHEAYKQEFYRQILYRVSVFKPDFLMVYKGNPFELEFIRQLNSIGVRTVNVYPDCSPHAHGNSHLKAVGEYELVISTKLFHPALWKEVYGYSNACDFVPQGYDPTLHLVHVLPTQQPYDVALVATWRPEYDDLMKRLAVMLSGQGVKIAIGGSGWVQRRDEFPVEWIFGGELQGRSYINWLRQGKICIAPVTREVLINGISQPGDEDTTRTYELAAAHCFFIHRRTDFVKTLYNETDEMSMYETPEELAEKIIHYLKHPDERARMAGGAHQRAVPAYSLDSRAAEVVTILQARLRCTVSNSVTESPSGSN